MDPETIQRCIEEDRALLRSMVVGFAAVEADVQWAMDNWISAVRGYFTPDEDDRVREMVLAYRAQRQACYGLLDRWRDHEADTGQPMPIEAFVVAYAAALSLYARSLLFVRAFEGSSIIRNKINEPDPKLDAPAGFFDDLIEGFSSPRNVAGLSRAHWRWLKQRREIRRLGRTHPETFGWILALVPMLQRRVRKQFLMTWMVRLRRDFRLALRLMAAPFLEGGSRVGVRLAKALAGKGNEEIRALGTEFQERLGRELRTGDILLVRAEGKLTTALLPGFWTHAAVYVRDQADLARLGIADHPYVVRHANAWPDPPCPYGHVVEAISPEVVIHGLDRCLRADHVVVLRPRLEPEVLGSAVAEAFGHLGKPYDYGFDFNVSHRIVCTELIYRAFHARGGISMDLVKRAGRFTLTGDDLVDIAFSRTLEPWFEWVDLVLTDGAGRPRVIPDSQRVDILTRLRTGWRPTRDPWEPCLG